jgi:hypothetical protein
MTLTIGGVVLLATWLFVLVRSGDSDAPIWHPALLVGALALFILSLVFGLEDKYRETPEQIRGIPDKKLERLTNEQLLCVGLARAMEAQGCEDTVLIKELYERGKYRAVRDADGTMVSKVYD